MSRTAQRAAGSPVHRAAQSHTYNCIRLHACMTQTSYTGVGSLACCPQAFPTQSALQCVSSFDQLAACRGMQVEVCLIVYMMNMADFLAKGACLPCVRGPMRQALYVRPYVSGPMRQPYVRGPLCLLQVAMKQSRLKQSSAKQSGVEFHTLCADVYRHSKTPKFALCADSVFCS